jgi:hypothetical protein
MISTISDNHPALLDGAHYKHSICIYKYHSIIHTKTSWLLRIRVGCNTAPNYSQTSTIQVQKLEELR